MAGSREEGGGRKERGSGRRDHPYRTIGGRRELKE